MNRSVVVLSVVAAVSVGTPLILAALGEILAERVGVMNLGVEGMMLLGAVVGIAGTFATGDPWIGLGLAGLAGMGMAVFQAFAAITLRVNQIVSGLALVIIGTGLSGYLGQLPTPLLTEREAVERFGPLFGGSVSDLPIVGPVLLGHDAVVYLSWLLVAVASYYLFHTRLGLAARAVGEDPATADASGIRVGAVRYVHTLVGGFLAGIGGGYLSIAITGIWQEGITAGAGWIAFALVSFSGWRPGRALVAAYVFGALISLSFTLQIQGIEIPSDLLAGIPFVLTLFALIVITASPKLRPKMHPPAALGIPYSRESR
ncbi:MAG: ABC transporter permease [Actinomycetota bacterium]